jgi:hypothetical protein
MTEIDGFANLDSCWLCVGEIVCFFPEESHHLNQEVAREAVETGGLGVKVVHVINLTVLLKFCLQT